MRSRIDSKSSLITDGADPFSPTQPLSLEEIARRARMERARVFAELIADLIVWVVRLPGRIGRFLRMRTARA